MKKIKKFVKSVYWFFKELFCEHAWRQEIFMYASFIPYKNQRVCINCGRREGKVFTKYIKIDRDSNVGLGNFQARARDIVTHKMRGRRK